MAVHSSRNINITRIITSTSKISKAIEDNTRIAILSILSHKSLNAEELNEELKVNGHNKSLTTIRHHMEILKEAGLIEVVRKQEVRGAVMKYYSATARILDQDIPSNFIEINNKLVEDIGDRLLKIIKSLSENKKFALNMKSREKTEPCRYCKVDHFKEFLIFEIINLSLAKISATKEYLEIISRVSTK